MTDSVLSSTFSKLTLQGAVAQPRKAQEVEEVIVLNEEDENEEDENEEDEDEAPKDFYVHIDLTGIAANRALPRKINDFMLDRFFFDPRRYFNFFDVVFHPDVPTRAQMRAVCTPALSATYYELWKVRSNFEVAELFRYLDGFDFQDATIKVTCLYDGDHQIYRHEF